MRRVYAVLFLSCALLTFSCARMPEREAVQASSGNRYSLEGTVVRLESGAKMATIKHRDITDASGKVWMTAMTMDFPVPDKREFAKLRVGQRIRATVHERDLDYFITEIRIEGESEPQS